ncbi:MAG: uroporphyrinogen-III C-methyltransferase [bacterium]
MAASGKVYLVGAGPGDPDLITVKGAQLLERCDAVVYDRLAPLELVITLPSSIKRYYVGKSTQSHTLSQMEINELLVKLAREGLRVIRLKGGDPFIFGRGAEEALYLRKQGILFEIVPGITAGLAATAYSGIPVTYRKKSVFAVLLTAHEAFDKDEPQVPWDWLGKTQHGTIIGYMGVKHLAQSVQRLIASGMDPNSPAAVVERGTTGLQRVISGILMDLPEKAAQAGIKPPALFVIGDAVSLTEQLRWFGSGILTGKTVMVTRPGDLAKPMYRLLRQHGAEVLPLPTISIRAHDDAVNWRKFQSILLSENQQDERWLVFTSESGVRHFFQQARQRDLHQRSLRYLNVAAVGNGTARELEVLGVDADFVPSRATTLTLARELSERLQGKNTFALRVRGNLGDDQVERTLAESGVGVLPLQVYRTETAVWDDGMFALLEERPPDIITFTSGSTVTSFCQILGDKCARTLAKSALIASIGPMTTEVAKKAGFKVVIEAQTHSVPGLVEAIVQQVSI